MVMGDKNDIAVIGLGVMGANLACNFARHGHRVGGFDTKEGAQARLEAKEPAGSFDVSSSLKEMVDGLERPRRIIVLVPSKYVDDVLDDLTPLLEKDDIVVDAGNSLFKETDARNKRADGEPWRFVGMGVSGGAEGALRGPSMMPGGDVEAWTRLKPLLESIAAQTDLGPCVTYCGRGSAGHFVKMTHNGIEYGDMQLIAESARLLRKGIGKSGSDVAETFKEWNEGELASFLIEITSHIFGTKDPKSEGLLVDMILDEAGQKGTGRWTVIAAIEMGIPVPTIAAAVDARGVSAMRSIRQSFHESLSPSRDKTPGLTPDDIKDALYAAKVASYTQGFQMLRAASAERDYGIDMAEVARIWTGGCIIRAALLRPMQEAFRANPDLELLAEAPYFAEELRKRIPALRKVVSAATAAGHAIPAFAASLTWLDGLSTLRSTANVIQAQRDYFGSHTYRRRDDPKTPVHTDWPRE